MNQQTIILTVLFLSTFYSGCGTDPGQNCVPGSTQECVCAPGVEGIQTCDEEGAGWDPCSCTETDTSTDPDVPVDTPYEGTCGTCIATGTSDPPWGGDPDSFICGYCGVDVLL